MEDFGDDLFDEFEKPSASSFSVEEQKSNGNQQNAEQKYEKLNYFPCFLLQFTNTFFKYPSLAFLIFY